MAVTDGEICECTADFDIVLKALEECEKRVERLLPSHGGSAFFPVEVRATQERHFRSPRP